ncbi:uncharacterized protein PHALS_04308 [Plasmopara halstedii]|uniref:Uncharacterized protein n=1 Tax=Plasmopara halstedii TaxID=4781 RepID=A0A0P1B097_PLAHL|nr:uncharacterized protein PHALS_04308 [Plasmopara halstedii]CEG47433.1 hypothetical protein PHALS_04308 [Plasmopara halstedii]|eukprot:XP_024583802.1 hypothetical protein PHALS_04308 [Plasmopara halstedii]
MKCVGGPTTVLQTLGALALSKKSRQSCQLRRLNSCGVYTLFVARSCIKAKVAGQNF